MLPRLLLCLALTTLGLASCAHPPKKDPKAEEAAKKKKKKPDAGGLKDMGNDQAFQAFIGRLRIAVDKKDRREIASVLTPDFGYRWDTPPPGETAFDYWDQHNSWGELSALLAKRFTPHEGYMASPPEFVTDSDNYTGYRMGVRNFNGSWRVAYFITGRDLLQ